MNELLVCSCVLLTLAGCGRATTANEHTARAHERPASTRSTPAQGTIPLGPPPEIVEKYIRRTAARVNFPVLLPQRFPSLPSSKTVGGSERTTGSASVYMGTFNNFAFKGVDGGHILLGGQRRRLSLQGRPGQSWPRPGRARPNPGLSLPTRFRSVPIEGGGRFQQEKPARILRRATVNGRPALILKAPPFPLGLIHGSHVIVIWNQRRHGYLVSLHFESARTPDGTPRLADRIAAALGIAESTVVQRSAA